MGHVWTTVKNFLDDCQDADRRLRCAAMTATTERVDKFEERRRELADAALQTLSELGYARTSLREIAQNSAFSHGVLHYYFRDKVDLITYCVRQYKAECVRRYDRIVTDSDTAAQLWQYLGYLIGQGHHHIVLDLRGMILIDSAGVDVLTRASAWTRR